MASCKNCKIYRKEYDEFRQEFDDEIVVNDTNPPNHYCAMYDDNIPPDIFYNGADCPYYEPKQST